MRATLLVSVSSISLLLAVACGTEGETRIAPPWEPPALPSPTGAEFDGGARDDASADAGTDSAGNAVPDAERPECKTGDISVRLACLPNIVAVREIENDADADAGRPRVPKGYRRFDFEIDQPVDHKAPAGAHFRQRLSLLHKAESAPMVLATSGYGLSTGVGEVTLTFASNQLQVEHRHFTPSIPAPPQWEHLDIEQSAADFHAITVALKRIYAAKWVNTGASKGGMTSVYHRRFYPGDVDATVAYVAPIAYGLSDPRYIEFVRNVGGATYAECRAKLAAVQTAVLQQRTAMIAKMEASGSTFLQLGGESVALEHAVLEMPFAFWQYRDPTNPLRGCASIPAPSASADTLYAFFEAASQLSLYGDEGFEYFTPYYYQAATQLGAPAMDDEAILPLLQHRATYNVASYAPKNVPISFDPQVMIDVQSWVKTSGSTLMFIYGEYDPWSAGKFELGAAADSYVYVAPGRNHAAGIGTLEATDRDTAVKTLERWLQATAVPRAQLRDGREVVEGDPDHRERRPRL